MSEGNSIRVALLGASGAVGGEALSKLLSDQRLDKAVSFGRRTLKGMENRPIEQHEIDVSDSKAYAGKLSGCQAAICTLGVGEPSKVSREAFLKIDKAAVLNFAQACKAQGVTHFSLLSSVGIDAKSSNFFLRTKGELVEELKALEFESLSIFQPSMILTPTNRYGVSQAIVLKVWPLLKPLLIGPLRKYRGAKVDVLGSAMAVNAFISRLGTNYFQWDDFHKLIS